MTPHRLALGICLLAAAATTVAGPQHIESPPARVALLELFTSEGCSSCPPADAWVGKLVGDPRLWRRLVPVAFHVDYWDYIGWPDRFADPAFSARQRDHARLGVLGSVYTPAFVVDGGEWRGWFRHPRLDLDPPPPAGVIRLEVDTGSGRIDATYRAAEALDGRLELHLTLLGFGLETEVRAGENAGRVLRHDFVVLGHERTTLRAAAGHRFHGRAHLPATDVQGGRRALAAWVSRAGDTRPIQATGGWLH
jgi:hypothetical protein